MHPKDCAVCAKYSLTSLRPKNHRPRGKTMSNDERYNGWANRETWALMLHIDNDQGLYDLLRGLVNDTDFGTVDEVRLQVTTLLDPDEYREEFGESQSPEIARMAHEVGSLWRVDWSEVVASLTED